MALDDIVLSDERGKMMRRAVVMNDIHVPFVDERALKLAYKITKDAKPHEVIVAGDLYDFYSLSRFEKDPSRITQLQEELDMGYDVLAKLKESAPRAKLILREGNHENRIERYVKKNPELHGLRAFKLETLACLEQLGVKYLRAHQKLMLNKHFAVYHGHTEEGLKMSQYGGYSAQGNIRKTGVSGMSGHVHRMGVSSETDMTGTKYWYENGCLCDTKPEYGGNMNWQQGISIVHYDKDTFYVEQIPFINYTARANGKIYKG